MFERAALIGLGLIGSSLAHVIRREKLARHIAGHAKSAATLKRAGELGLADSYHASAAAVFDDATASGKTASDNTNCSATAIPTAAAPCARKGAIIGVAIVPMPMDRKTINALALPLCAGITSITRVMPTPPRMP